MRLKVEEGKAADSRMLDGYPVSPDIDVIVCG